MENELFGHEKGAFTGATGPKKGRFQLADQGTLFLDEIAEMTPATQAKILRVLQEREFEPVGGSRTIQVDTRIISATNRNLEDEISAGRFREDLYYRLNVVNLGLPPLRNRGEDIPLLAQHFLENFARKNNKSIKGFTPQAMDQLLRHEWPGKVRELMNIVERGVVLSRSEYLDVGALPLVTGELPDNGNAMDHFIPADMPLDEVEKISILKTLEMAGGNKSETARRLGITRRTLHKKLKKYGVM